jgi:CRP/FNR family cyclic AMP-dependent transcriptional regulator
MKTQRLPAQSESEMLDLKNILVPIAFSLPSHNAARTVRMAETTPDSMATRLAWHPFLVGMNRRHLELLADCAVAVQFKKGEVLFQEGEPADRFYLIETGKVILESSSGLGDSLLGWSWMFPPHIWTFTARAVEPITAVFFYSTILREYCEKDHSLGYDLLKRISLMIYQRMQAARNRMLTIPHRGDALQAGGGAVCGAGTLETQGAEDRERKFSDRPRPTRLSNRAA